MIPTQALRNQAMSLLAADPTTLAPAALPIYVVLFSNNAAPSEQSVLADFTPANFTGSAPIAVTVGAQPEGFDPGTNDSLIDISPPVGGFRWITGDAMNLPEKIYGYILVDHAQTLLLAAQLLPAPILLTAAAQRIDLGDVNLRLPANSIT